MRKIKKITPYNAKVIINQYIKITSTKSESILQRIGNLKTIQQEYKKWTTKKLKNYKSKTWKTRIKRKREFYRELARKEVKDVLKQDITDDFLANKEVIDLIKESYKKSGEYYSYQSRVNSNWVDDIEYLQNFLGDWFMDIEVGTPQKILSRNRLIEERWNGDWDSFWEDYNRYFAMKSKGVI